MPFHFILYKHTFRSRLFSWIIHLHVPPWLISIKMVAHGGCLTLLHGMITSNKAQHDSLHEAWQSVHKHFLYTIHSYTYTLILSLCPKFRCNYCSMINSSQTKCCKYFMSPYYVCHITHIHITSWH